MKGNDIVTDLPIKEGAHSLVELSPTHDENYTKRSFEKDREVTE